MKKTKPKHQRNKSNEQKKVHNHENENDEAIKLSFNGLILFVATQNQLK